MQVVVSFGGRADGAKAPDHSQQINGSRPDQLDEELLLAPEVLVERRT